MKKLLYKNVKEEIEKEGYKLLSEEYVDAKTKLELECPEGHKYRVRYSDFNQGQRCPICAGNQRYTIEEVREFMESKGYKLLSKEYNNNHTKLELMCPKGHKFWMTYGNFQQKQRCPQCHYNNMKLTYEEVKEYIEDKRYKLLSKEYKNSQIKLELECPEGHIFWMTWACFQQGSRCPQCWYESIKHSYEHVKEYIENKGYKLLSEEYKGAHTKLKLECPKGHIFLMSWSCFEQGQRCPQCCYENVSSKGEKEVLEYIQSITDTIIIENDRTQIINPKTGYNLELDIFLQDLKKAIEYNGSYWHLDKETKYRDNQKVVQCKEKGINFLVINENDWINNNEGCKKDIRKLLGENK